MNNISIFQKGLVIKDPNILGGTAVIKGTRIPASLVIDLLKRGYTPELITQEYPSLTRHKLNSFLSLVSKSFDVPAYQAL